MAVRIVHKSKGYAALLKDPKGLADLRARAQRIANASGEGFEVQSSTPHTRARAAVVAATPQARRRNSANNTLIRNLDAGR